MPKNAANQTFSGLIYTDNEAKPSASAATIFSDRSEYLKSCFNGNSVLFRLSDCLAVKRKDIK